MDASFRDYAEQCPDAVLVTDRDGRIEYVNTAFERMTGYRRKELMGNRPAALKSGTHEADFYRALWGALLAGQEFRAVFTNRKKGGELYYEEKIIRPLGNSFVSFGRDVTERPVAAVFRFAPIGPGELAIAALAAVAGVAWYEVWKFLRRSVRA